jgi:preprotein translocase subunit SecE
MFDKTKTFLKEVSVELKKVSWPTRQQTISATVVVIVLTIIVSVFLGIIDFALGRLVGAIMG